MQQFFSVDTSSVCVSDNCSCQKLDAMAQQWPFSERRLKKILQNVVEEAQLAREGVYTWLTVESLDKEIDNFLNDLTKEVFLKSFEDGEHKLAIHFMNMHPAKLLETCEQFVESTIKRIQKEKERSRRNQLSSFRPDRFKAAAEAALTKDSCEQEQKQDKHRKKPVSEMGGKGSSLPTSLTFDVVRSGDSNPWEQLVTDSAKQLAEEQTERVREILMEEQIHCGEEGGEHIEAICGAGQKRRRHGGDEKK